jgi:CRISPR/Cas system-associated exonuclease Cas4 (RecB family)
MKNVSHSKLKDWKMCRQLYYYRHVEGLRPRRKSNALYMGSMLHDMLSVFNSGGKWELILEGYELEFSKLFIEEQEELGDIIDNAERIMRGYIKRWGDKLPFTTVEEKIKGIEFIKGTNLTIKTDGVIEDNGYWLVEHKSTKKFSPDQISLFNPQGILYLWGLRQTGVKVKGILWDYIRTKPPTIPRVLKDGTVSRKASIDTDYDTYHDTIIASGNEPKEYQGMLAMLRNKGGTFYKRSLLIIPEPTIKLIIADLKQTAMEIARLQNYPTRNISTITCRGCQFRRLCEATLNNVDVDFIKKKNFKRREDKKVEDKRKEKSSRGN